MKKKDTSKPLMLYLPESIYLQLIKIKELDYFFTNAISRASKTMSECRQIKHSSKKTGTDNL